MKVKKAFIGRGGGGGGGGRRVESLPCLAASLYAFVLQFRFSPRKNVMVYISVI